MPPLPPNPKVVFLDRISIRAQLRPLSFAHEWHEYPTTPPELLVERLQGASIAITNRCYFGDPQLDQLPELKLIAVSATGYDCLDIEACRRHNVTVLNVPNWSSSAVAEHTFALILALRRQLFTYRPLVQAGEWQKSPFYGLLENPIPLDLEGSNIGIVGFGNLGQKVATIARGFGMNLLVADHKGVASPRPGRTAFDDVLTQSDVLCITCPMTPQTRGLFDAPTLARLKPTAILVNCARGNIVDDDALANALRAGRIAGAGVDVLRQEPPRDGNPLLDLQLPNLIVTPHIAFASEHALARLVDQLVTNIEAFAAGKPVNVVS
jgi:glycerate dehydrogenase